MSEALYITGDVFEVMAGLPDGSVDLVLTSPPFLALRSYLPADHPDKDKEIGSEPTPAAFLDTTLALTAEWDRVLAPHGSICVELGDTYAGSGGAGGDYADDGMHDGQPKFRQVYDAHAWPLPKSIAGIPWLYALSLAYGRNLLTGEESPAGQWRVRNVVAWCRPNPPVGALGDKFRPATSYLTIATKAQGRYFDLDAVREPHSANTHARVARGASGRTDLPSQQRGGNWSTLAANNDQNPAGAPPLDFWVIPTAPYAGSHYAVYPPALCERPIKAMVPLKVCEVCGEPSRRIVEVTGLVDRKGRQVEREVWSSGIAEGKAAHSNKTTSGTTTTTTTTTTGWTDCGHNSWRTGRVLDPFGGSGTTGAVATGHGRDAILIDLDARNVDLARDRIGPLMFTEATVAEAAAWLAARNTTGAVA